MDWNSFSAREVWPIDKTRESSCFRLPSIMRQRGRLAQTSVCTSQKTSGRSRTRSRASLVCRGRPELKQSEKANKRRLHRVKERNAYSLSEAAPHESQDGEFQLLGFL